MPRAGLYKGDRVKFTATFLTNSAQVWTKKAAAKFKKYRGTITDISGDWANPTILVQWDRAKKINTHRIYEIEAAADLPQPKRPKSATLAIKDARIRTGDAEQTWAEATEY